MTLKIQYRDSTGTYVDAPAKLYCLLNQSINFKAVTTQAQPNYASTNWGAAGNGQTVSIVMAPVSAANTDAAAKSVTATLSGESAEVKVVVWTGVATVNPVRNSPQARLNPIALGVDERANLGFTTSPVGVTAAAVGGLKWTLTGGVAGRKRHGVLQRTATDPSGPGDDGAAFYTAPYLTDDTSDTVQAAATKTVQISLVVQGGPCKGQRAAQQNLTIHRPTGTMVMRNGSGIHSFDHISAGFIADIYLTPDGVNFETLEFREAGGSWTTHTGPFAGQADVHSPTTIGTDGVPIQVVNGRNHVGGANTYDAVYTYGVKVPAVPPAPANHTGLGIWQIYRQYRVREQFRATGQEASAMGSWLRFQTAVHQASSDAAGRCTQSKALATISYNLTDAKTAQATALSLP